jgi:trans-aconitate 2-methyltransferase
MTEWHASDYFEQSSLQWAMAQEQLGSLTVHGSERVLDVGCGDGKITAAIAARVPAGSVIGVDPSRDMIAFAMSHFGPPEYANLSFAVADARQLPYQNEFDLVVSFNALHWVPEQERALCSIRATMKPAARALLRFVPAGPRKSLEDVIEDVRREPRWAGSFAGFEMPYLHLSAPEYQALAEKCGFQVVRINVLDKAWDFKTREGFAGFSRATFVAWTQRLPQSEWEAFIADVLERYRAVATDNAAEDNTFKFYQMEVTLAAG